MALHSKYHTFDIDLPTGQTTTGRFFSDVCEYIRWTEGSATGRALLFMVDQLLQQQRLELRISQVPQGPNIMGFRVWGPMNTRMDLRCAEPFGAIVAPWHTPAVPRAIYFAHELVHAVHHLQGTWTSNTATEEWATIGLGRHAGNRFSENRIRCEMNLPLRTSRHDLTAGHNAQDEINRFHLQGYADPVCLNGTYTHPLRAGQGG